MTLVVGLTGGIGSGKSAVAAAFRALGVEVVDADEVAHELSAPGHEGHRAVVAAFGDSVLAADGTLDRAKLRERAFADPSFRVRLEAALHPPIREEIRRRVGRRSGLAPAEVRAIMATQLGRADRLARADDVIDNSGPPEALAGAVARLDASYRALAAARRDARP